MIIFCNFRNTNQVSSNIRHLQDTFKIKNFRMEMTRN